VHIKSLLIIIIIIAIIINELEGAVLKCSRRWPITVQQSSLQVPLTG